MYQRTTTDTLGTERQVGFFQRNLFVYEFSSDKICCAANAKHVVLLSSCEWVCQSGVVCGSPQQFTQNYPHEKVDLSCKRFLDSGSASLVKKNEVHRSSTQMCFLCKRFHVPNANRVWLCGMYIKPKQLRDNLSTCIIPAGHAILVLKMEGNISVSGRILDRRKDLELGAGSLFSTVRSPYKVYRNGTAARGKVINIRYGQTTNLKAQLNVHLNGTYPNWVVSLLE